MCFVAIKMGRRQGGPSRTGGRRVHPAPFYAPIWFSPAGTKMVRDVTDPAAAHARQHKEALQISSLKGDQISAQGFNP
jgi:hypothetical protein